MKFFTPTRAFLDWIASPRLRSLIYDVGAGEGHVFEALRAKGIQVLAIDLYPGGDLVLAGDGTTYRYYPGTTVMLCRPCHGLFVYHVIQQAVLCEVGRVVYVGLDKNVEGDLDDYLPKFKMVLNDAGEDGEKVWVWEMKRREKREKVALVDYTGSMGAYWVYDRGDRWENSVGSGCPKSPCNVVLAEDEIEDGDFGALDWTKSGYVIKDSDYGWLSPEGVFTPCAYCGHISVAYCLLKMTQKEAEEAGYVRVNGPPTGEGALANWYLPGLKPTLAQQLWLAARGHDPEGVEELSPEVRAIYEKARDARDAEKFIKEAEARGGKPKGRYRDGD